MKLWDLFFTLTEPKAKIYKKLEIAIINCPYCGKPTEHKLLRRSIIKTLVYECSNCKKLHCSYKKLKTYKIQGKS